MKTHTDSQGARANAHGESNRESIAAILLAHDFQEVGVKGHTPRLADFDAAIRGDLRQPRKAFAVDVPLCKNVHGFPYPAHFLLTAPGWPEPLALMTRTQNKSGSIVEKLEFLYASVNEGMPCRTLILFSGSKFTPRVLARARLWVERSRGRIAQVFASLDEFRLWLTSGHPWPPVPVPVLPGMTG